MGFEVTRGSAIVSVLAAAALPAASRAASDSATLQNYTAMKGEVKLALYRKSLPSTTPKPVLVLVHGSSAGGLTTYDLHVPGGKAYSMMDAFADTFDVWTLDHEGYARSARTNGNSDIASGVADLAAATSVIMRETGAKRVHLCGESSGALRAGGFAIAYPERVDRLVLNAFVYTGKGGVTLAKRAQQAEQYRTNNRRPVNRDFYLSIFTRDKAGTSDPAVAEAYAASELTYGDSVPTGTYLDMVTKLPIVDPSKLTTPTLVIRGEYDGIATEADVFDFFSGLPNADRQFVIIPGAAHSSGFSYNRERFWYAVRAFLNVPPRRDVSRA